MYYYTCMCIFFFAFVSYVFQKRKKYIAEYSVFILILLFVKALVKIELTSTVLLVLYILKCKVHVILLFYCIDELKAGRSEEAILQISDQKTIKALFYSRVVRTKNNDSHFNRGYFLTGSKKSFVAGECRLHRGSKSQFKRRSEGSQIILIVLERCCHNNTLYHNFR